MGTLVKHPRRIKAKNQCWQRRSRKPYKQSIGPPRKIPGERPRCSRPQQQNAKTSALIALPPLMTVPALSS